MGMKEFDVIVLSERIILICKSLSNMHPVFLNKCD